MTTKYTLLSITLLIASCTTGESENQRKMDTPENVIIIPNDSIGRNMPVEQMNTTKSNMPVVSPDTSKIQPK